MDQLFVCDLTIILAGFVWLAVAQPSRHNVEEVIYEDSSCELPFKPGDVLIYTGEDKYLLGLQEEGKELVFSHYYNPSWVVLEYNPWSYEARYFTVKGS